MAKKETAPRTYRPNQIAETAGVSAKQVRAYLRQNFPRDAEDKNTSWEIDRDTAKAVLAHFRNRGNSETEDES